MASYILILKFMYIATTIHNSILHEYNIIGAYKNMSYRRLAEFGIRRCSRLNRNLESLIQEMVWRTI